MRFPRVMLLVLACALPSSLAAQVAGVQREVYTNLNREAFSLARLTNHPNFLAGKPTSSPSQRAG